MGRKRNRMAVALGVAMLASTVSAVPASAGTNQVVNCEFRVRSHQTWFYGDNGHNGWLYYDDRVYGPRDNNRKYSYTFAVSGRMHDMTDLGIVWCE